jgi:hypothetical protein
MKLRPLKGPPLAEWKVLFASREYASPVARINPTIKPISPPRPIDDILETFLFAAMVDTHGSWPFQVAIPDDSEVGIAATAYCADRHLSLRVMGPSAVHEGRRWSVFCFAEYEDAVQLRGAFKGKWIHAHLWRGVHSGRDGEIA